MKINTPPGELVLVTAHPEFGLRDYVLDMARETAEATLDKKVVILTRKDLPLFSHPNICVENPRITDEIVDCLHATPNIALAIIEHRILFMRDDDYIVGFTRKLRLAAETLNIPILVTSELPDWVVCPETESLFMEKYSDLDRKIVVKKGLQT